MLQRLASRLTGLAATLKTRGDAVDCRALIEGMNVHIVEHLIVEDTEVYPSLMVSEDHQMQALARDSFAEMGVILGAWKAYRQVWSVDRMLADQRQFSTSTGALMEALAMRIAMENDVLYPAVEKIRASERASRDGS